MPIAERLRTFLNESHVAYRHSAHSPAYTARGVAYAELIAPHRLAKTIVFQGEDGYGMAVVPADRYVDLHKLQFALRLSYVRLASEDELKLLFPDSEVGAMPPFGNLYGIPVFVDVDLAEEGTITFNAGTHQDVVYMRFADFERLVRPTVTSFSAKQTENTRDLIGVHDS
jgi:Ala-tRNA(Pro) deacylase